MKLLYAPTNLTGVGLLRNLLEEAGIESEVRNEFLCANYPIAPFYPELWVLRDEDLAKAVEIREDWRSPPSATGSSWTCPDCGESLEEQFTSCWKCGGDRAGMSDR